MTMDDSPTHETGLPPTSRAVVVGLAAVLSSLLFLQTGLGRLLPVVAATGLALAGSLWLAGWERWTAVGHLLASLLVVPTAVGLLAVAGGAIGIAIGGGNTGPGVAAAALVALGGLLSAFGAATAPWGVYDHDRALAAVGLAGRTMVPLTVAAGVSVASGIVRLSSSGDGSGTPLGALLAPVVDLLFAPTPGRTHIAVFCLFLAVVTIAFERAMMSLPLTELLAETTDDADLSDAVESASRALGIASVAAVAVGLLALGIETGRGQAVIADTLPAGLYDLTVSLTGSPGVRQALWTVFVASVVVRLAVWLVQRAARSSADRLATVLAPYVGGSLLAGGLFVVATPLLDALLATVQSAAPAPVAAGVTRLVTPLVGSYGAGLVLLVAGLALLSVTSTAVGCLWLALVTHYLDERNPGVHIGAAGLFGATVFAATMGVSTWLVLAGLVGAVVVWDAGTFGRTLRREVGPAAETRRTELTHAGGTVAVGGVGVALTLVVLDVSRGTLAVAPGTGYVTLVVALFAAIVLAVALR
ncbi:hypothetical protein EGH22_14925 [Halomicroarcula sp. F28]|uniref:DUF7519 family protein n=1 Tax=Haloarcula salinisoli TaxID=2487746 RepID=UPI001C7368DF|nr:hypothetical protein [Halomicroarcula salinisoli]MBX0287625.1 hypothetical protein [Halomicroarcula salinisoli]